MPANPQPWAWLAPAINAGVRGWGGDSRHAVHDEVFEQPEPGWIVGVRWYLSELLPIEIELAVLDFGPDPGLELSAGGLHRGVGVAE